MIPSENSTFSTPFLKATPLSVRLLFNYQLVFSPPLSLKADFIATVRLEVVKAEEMCAGSHFLHYKTRYEKMCSLTKPCSTIKVTHIQGFVTIETYANVAVGPVGTREDGAPRGDAGSKSLTGRRGGRRAQRSHEAEKVTCS